MIASAHVCGRHRAYRLTCADYDALAGESKAGCQCCGAEGEALEIDHDHAVGVNAVRGLVCRPCNGALRAVDAELRKPRPYERAYLDNAWHHRHQITPVPDGKTRVRTVRVDDDLWTRAQDAAWLRRETVSDVIRRALVELVEKHDGKPIHETATPARALGAGA